MLSDAVSYFKPPANYFWRWAENGKVAEGQHMGTICYRDDLVQILRALAPYGLPPLGSVLLVIAACHEGSYGIGATQSNITKFLESLKIELKDIPRGLLEEFNQVALKLINTVRNLPVDLRSGNARIHLINTLFEKTARPVVGNKALEVIDEFTAHVLDAELLSKNKPYLVTIDFIEKEFVAISSATYYYTDTETLAQKLKTSVFAPPEPVKIAVPVPENLDAPLMVQLEADVQTAGIARLTQSIVAALNIPMHSRNAGDQPIGGISDITNRGNFDKLLISELANDDLTLTARLVNNEALYLRREVPPVNMHRQRNILIDSTIRLWGKPRIYGISAALACTLNTQHLQAVNCYILTGAGFLSQNFATKAGVLRGMETLSADLHCIPALLKFITEHESIEGTENILVTSEASLQNAQYLANYQYIQQGLKFLVSVNRDGHLNFYEFVNGHRKLLSTAHLDLNELLKEKRNRVKPQTYNDKVPAFYQQKTAPLFYPTTQVRPSLNNFFCIRNKEFLGTTETQRLLYWPEHDKGAIELLPFIEKGNYKSALCPLTNKLYIFAGTGDVKYQISPVTLKEQAIYCPGPDGSVLYVVHLRSLKEPLKLSNIRAEVLNIATDSNVCFIETTEGIKTVVEETEKISVAKITNARFIELLSYQKSFTRPDNTPNRHINNGYSALHRIENIAVTNSGNICFGLRELKLLEDQSQLKFKEMKVRSIATKSIKTELKDIQPGTLLKGTCFKHTNGHSIIIDSNGLAHFKAGNDSLPEFTITSVINKSVAGWTSDGKIFGSPYFVPPGDTWQKISAKEFYINYLKKFAEQLR